MNIARYAQRATRYWKQAERRLRTVEGACSSERQQRRQLQQDADDMKDRIRELEQGEAKLKKWEGRKAVINHYLGAVQEMSRCAHCEYAVMPSVLIPVARS